MRYGYTPGGEDPAGRLMGDPHLVGRYSIAQDATDRHNRRKLR
jgi:hypothetical protein